MIRIWLPFPPSTNNLFPHRVIKGRIIRVPSARYKKWREDASAYIWAAKAPRFTDPVELVIELVPPDNKERDADNHTKAPIDALVYSKVISRDSQRQIKSLRVYWHNPSFKPGCIVGIRTIEPGLPPLTATQRTLLATVRSEEPCFRLARGRRPSADLKALLQMGYVSEVPGLLDNSPMGYRCVD